MMFADSQAAPTMSAGALSRYGVYGITLLSELRLDLPTAGQTGSGDVVVELRVLDPNAFPSLIGEPARDPSDWFHHAVLSDRTLYMRWRDWVEFLVSPDGGLVLCANLRSAPLASFEAYLVNFAVSAALFQKGEEPLHATVVEIGSRAVGLVGPSGAGKSTLAAYLIGRGGRLVTDDMLRVTFEGDAAQAHLGPNRLKLFRESAERFMPSAVARGRFTPFGEKLLFKPPGPATPRVARRLSALFSLDWPSAGSDPKSVCVTRLTGLELFKTIASSTMNSRLDLSVRLQRQFNFAERLAKSVPVYRLSYSRNYDVLGEVADRIMEEAPQ